MPNVSPSQLSFTGGEWSPSLAARVDLGKYATALKTCRNFIVHPHGGVSNRGGLGFVAEVKDSTKKVKLIEFQFSVVQSYILEFGDYYMRVIKDGGLVVLSSTPDTWATGTTYSKDDKVAYNGVNYYSLVDTNTNNYPNTSPGYWYPLTDDIVEVKTPYAESDLQHLKFTQSHDILFLTHPDHAPYELSRTDHDAWAIEAVPFGSVLSAPTGLSYTGSWSGTGEQYNYEVTAVTADGEESGPSGNAQYIGDNQTLTWSAVADADHYLIYRVSNGTYGYVARADTNSWLWDDYSADMDKSVPQSNNPFNSANNYPGCCTFFEQRLLFGRTDVSPQTIWGSKIGLYRNMDISSPLQDDDSYEFTIAAGQVNEIRWMVPLEALIIGTAGGEWRMLPGGSSDAVTPTSVDIKRQSNYGCSHVRPLLIGNTILFVEGSGSVIRDLAYSLESDGYKGNDISILSNHLFRNNKVTDWAYQQYPDSIVWAVRDDGTLLGLTYAREHEVWGWHRHDTQGTFESVASITSEEGESEVYVVVKRTINGSVKRYVEMFRPRLPDDDINKAFFVDSGLTYNGWNETSSYLMTLTGSTWAAGDTLTLTASGGITPFDSGDVGTYYRIRSGDDYVTLRITAYTSATEVSVTPTDIEVPASLQATATDDWAAMATTLSGLGHLEGETVSVLADGSVAASPVVSSGSVTLAQPVTIAHVGLPYTSDIETLNVEVQAEGGTIQNKRVYIHEVTFILENTRSVQYGPDEDNLSELSARTSERYGEPIQLFTGDRRVSLRSGDGGSGRVFIRVTDPVPITVLAIIPKVSYGDL